MLTTDTFGVFISHSSGDDASTPSLSATSRGYSPCAWT